MTTQMHYGKWVDSETPVPGVISQNKLNWDCIDETCLDCEEYIEEVNNDDTLTEDEKSDKLEYLECVDHVKIIGDWKKDEDGKYIPDEDGEFAAILSSSSFNDCTVIWSKTIKTGVNLCSPCAPGQASIESDGKYSCYDLPEYMKYKEE